ncbi:Ig-like domain-containing protein [Candidatus Enterococcus clewellii]|uniref:BIG2 domain-containing protein n=2 Tax=Candidatus Enterococcus clewellii TaxID=1834193 RepID=A0AAQ3VUS8_9ENTE
MKKKNWLFGMALLTFMACQSGEQIFAEESEILVEGIVEEVGSNDIKVVSEHALGVSDSSDFSVEQVRKIQDYQKKYREIRNNEVVDEKFDIAPIIGPDQYTTGTFKPSTLENATAYINLLRESTGMPPVSISQSRVSIAQHGAVGLASLRVIDHYIETNYTKPEGMTEQFWQEASKGARSSNLVRSVRSPIHGDLIPTLNDFSDMYMFDYGSNNQTVGHRRIILNPLYKTIGFGFAQLEVPEKREVEYTGTLYAQRDSGNTVSDDSITTWPTETIFPVQNMRRYNNTLRWSVSFNSIGYDFDQKNLKVTLTNNKSGQEWNFSNEQKDGEFTISTNNWGYDTVVFAPNGINYAEGDEYTVRVEGLIGKVSSYEYTTKLYDLNKEYKIPMEDFNFDENFIKMQLGEERKVTVSYAPDDAEYTGKLVWKSSNANLVSVSQDGILKAKSANGQSVPITVTSEDGKIRKTIKVSVATVQLGATKESAQEIEPGFVAANGQSSQIYVNQTGWVKFKANESAMYGLVGGIFGTNVVNQKSEINFHNGWENRSLGYSSLQRKTSSSGTASSNLPVYYAAGDYVYLKLSTSIDGEPFYFSLTRDTNNAQPIYTKK